MFRPLAPTVICLALTVGGAWAKPPPAASLRKAAKRCDDGVAVACYEYGKLLRQSAKANDKRRANFYIRRACALAYAPACGRPMTVAEKKVKDKRPRVDSKGRACSSERLAKEVKFNEDGRSIAEFTKDSVWQLSGVLPNDEVVSVNGQTYTDPAQVGQAFEKGDTVLNVMRSGRETSLMLSCP